MQIIRNLEFISNSKEENLPQYEENFPYICTEARVHEFSQRCVPWHWHAALELFYMERGHLECATPGGKVLFEEGSVGLINSNILHTTKPTPDTKEVVQKLHFFDVSLIAGAAGSRITEKYITPLVTCPGLEVVAIHPHSQKEIELIERVKQSFLLDEKQVGYELLIRNCLSEIWLRMFELIKWPAEEKKGKNYSRDSLKAMMIYIHEHYHEKMTVEEVAEAGFLSVRECYRIFHDGLHCTPMEYLNEYRIQTACSMLRDSMKSMTQISHECGFNSSSYFTRSFQRSMGCSPTAYRMQETQMRNEGQQRFLAK